MFARALESLKIKSLMGFLYLNERMYEPKIYKGVMCHDNEQ